MTKEFSSILALTLALAAVPQAFAADEMLPPAGTPMNRDSDSRPISPDDPGHPDRLRSRQSSPVRRIRPSRRRPPTPMVSSTPDGTVRNGMSDSVRGTSEAPRGTTNDSNKPTTPITPSYP